MLFLTLKCTVCEKDFISGRKDRKYCSRKCSKKNEEKRGNVPVCCPSCSVMFERSIWYIRRQEKLNRKTFCSKSCASEYSNTNRYEKRLLICEGCKQEFLLKESDAKDKYCSNKCYVEHQKVRLTQQCKNMSLEAMEKSSSTKTQRWIEGKYDSVKNCYAQGKFFFQKAGKEVWYRSSWELSFMKYLDEQESVIKCEYETIRIKYIDINKKNHYYIPDILVEYKNGEKVLYEIKPLYQMDNEINKSKFKAAKQYCNEQNIKFEVITEKYLKHLGVL